MKQTRNSGNFACKFLTSPGFARLKNLLSTKRARIVTTTFAIFAATLSLCFLQNPSFASLLRTPATYLNISTSTPNVDFQFNQSELSSSAFKTNNVTVNVQTDNATGATTYISSIDEATSLVHSDSGVSDSIASISSPLLSTAFSGKTWGYRVGSLATTGFNPIPKASTPAEILNTTSATPASNNLNINFGVKVSPDLSSGTYSKQILFTTITNYVQLRTTFLPGPAFNPIVLNLDTMHLTTGSFEHSATPPANLSDATIVSTADSEKPIYAWFDSTSQKVLWWTEADVAYANEDCSYMFDAEKFMGHSIGNIDLRGINTSRVKSMKHMFNGGKEGLTGLNLSEMDTSNVEDMSYMFTYMHAYGSSDAVTLDLSRFNISKVKNMEGMFINSAVTPLDLRSFDTSNVEDMSRMFYRTFKLKHLNLQSFDTKKVKNMTYMFAFSSTDPAGDALDISSFDTRSLASAQQMFGHIGVKCIYASNTFTTDLVSSQDFMFSNSPDLIGGSGTVYSDSNPKDKTYARIDAPGTPGYFTQKP